MKLIVWYSIQRKKLTGLHILKMWLVLMTGSQSVNEFDLVQYTCFFMNISHIKKLYKIFHYLKIISKFKEKFHNINLQSYQMVSTLKNRNILREEFKTQDALNSVNYAYSFILSRIILQTTTAVIIILYLGNSILYPTIQIPFALTSSKQRHKYP